MSPLPQCRAGMSLLEVVIAIAIGALSVMAVSSLIVKPMELVEDTVKKLDTQTTTDKKDVDLIRRFARTHVMRRGFITCSDSDIGEILADTSSFTGRSLDLEPPFSFAYSEFSTLVSVESTAPAVLTLPGVEAPLSVLPGVPLAAGNPFQGDLKYFSAGSVVLLTAINAPTVGRMFQITEVNPGDSTIRLDANAIEFPTAFREGTDNLCDVVSTPGITSLSTLVNSDPNRIFGEPSNIFRADIVRFVTLYREESLGNPNDLWERVWPVPEFGAEVLPVDLETLVRRQFGLTEFARLGFEQASWTPTGGVNPSIGRFEALVKLEQRQRGLATSGQRGVPVPITATRRRVSFDTSTGGQRNFGAVTVPAPADARFPTCGLMLSPAKDYIQRSDNVFGQFYELSGETADVAGISGISVDMSTPAGQTARCWNEDQLVPTATLQEVPVAAAQVNTGNINPTASGALSKLLCDIPNNSSLSGLMSYFDSSLSTMVTVSCAATATAAGPPPTFAYNGAPTTCSLSGNISFGRLVETGTSTPGPTLFALECEWLNLPGGFSPCTPDPTKGDLLRVRLGPTGLPGGIPGAGGGGNDEISCS